MILLRRLARFLGSVLLCAAFGSVWQSAYNLLQIAQLGHPPSALEALATVGHDLVHFAPTYAALSAVALLVAFLIAHGLSAWTGRWRRGWFALGGALAIVTMLTVMNWSLPVTAIAAARDGIGIAGLCAGGLLAGLLFAFTAPRATY